MFIIYTSARTKRTLASQAAKKDRSLCAEAVLSLLERYQPPGWQALALDVARRSRLRNNRATTVNDGQPETIGIVFPDGLREEIERVARRNCRSINAEIVHFLEGENVDRNFVNRG